MVIISTQVQGRTDLGVLTEHSKRLADQWSSRRGNGSKIDIAPNPTFDDLGAIIGDGSISTVAFIGHGSLSAVRFYEGDQYKSVSWYDFARMSGPLKQGI